MSAAPLLDNIIHSVTAAVPSPNQTVAGQTVFDLWDKVIRTMGSGSDFTAFQDFAGVPSVDIGFDSGPDTPVYHYHSNYDSFHWMQKFGDPGFEYHRAMAQIIGLMAAKLADVPVVSFRAGDYARALDRYVGKVEDKLDASLYPQAELEANPSPSDVVDDDSYFELRSRARNATLLPSFFRPGHSDAETFRLSLQRLHRRIAHLEKRADKLDKRAKEIEDKLERNDIPWWNWPAKIRLGLALREVNTKYKLMERSFLYEQGLDGRPWFKHVVFAPGLWTGYAGGEFSPIFFSCFLFLFFRFCC